MKTLRYRTASVRAAALPGLAIGRIAGVVTAENAAGIIADSPNWCAGPGQALVADYSGAALGLDATRLLLAARTAVLSGANLVPTALVASAEQIETFSAYCRAAGESGLLRAVFLSSDDALAWAARQAQVHEYWAGLRRELAAKR